MYEGKAPFQFTGDVDDIFSKFLNVLGMSTCLCFTLIITGGGA